jgi:hypothetical protein
VKVARLDSADEEENCAQHGASLLEQVLCYTRNIIHGIAHVQGLLQWFRKDFLPKKKQPTSQNLDFKKTP